jgi:hypothetical protein
MTIDIPLHSETSTPETSTFNKSDPNQLIPRPLASKKVFLPDKLLTTGNILILNLLPVSDLICWARIPK